MEDLLKKFLYTGVGLASLTTEKLQETVDELVGKGKVSKDEGKKIIDDFTDRVEERRSDFEKRMQEMVDSFSASINLPKMASKDDIDALNQRIAMLEAKLEQHSHVEPAPVAKETPAVEAKETPKTTTAKRATRTKKTS